MVLAESKWTPVTEQKARCDQKDTKSVYGHCGSGSSTSSETKVNGSTIIEDQQNAKQIDIHQAASTLHTKNLIIATGIACLPRVPHFPGSQNFNATIIHSSQLGQQQQALLKKDNMKTIAVLGSGKSAYDAVHLAASQGVQVGWIVERSDSGPAWTMPAYANLGPFNARREKLLTRRIVGLLSPNVNNNNAGGFGWFRELVHGTRIGKAFTRKFWQGMYESTIDDCGCDKHQTAKLLEPEFGLYWYGVTSAILNYSDDFFKYIRDGTVRIYREDIASLSAGTINLANGTLLPVQALVTATGSGT